jgi:hypothetical protein
MDTDLDRFGSIIQELAQDKPVLESVVRRLSSLLNAPKKFYGRTEKMPSLFSIGG